MKFIIELFKLSIVAFLGSVVFYITDCIRYGYVGSFVDFMKDIYPYMFVIIVLAALAKERINHSR